jgi:hypothetical protein
VAKLHFKSDEEKSKAINWSLQQLFCLFGDKTSTNKLLNSFSADPELGMVLPSYHPKLASNLVSKEHLAEVSALAENVELDSELGLYAYPAGGMFCYRPSALQQQVLNLMDDSDCFKVLPALLSSKGFSSQLTHLL